MLKIKHVPEQLFDVTMFPIMFTLLFTLGRLPGWIAQWNEMVAAPGHKIARPRQLYTGPQRREFVPIALRSA
jgi:citrate synthase